MPDLFDALSIIAAKRFAEERGRGDQASEARQAADRRVVSAGGRPVPLDEPRPAIRVSDARRRRVLGGTR